MHRAEMSVIIFSFLFFPLAYLDKANENPNNKIAEQRVRSYTKLTISVYNKHEKRVADRESKKHIKGLG